MLRKVAVTLLAVFFFTACHGQKDTIIKASIYFNSGSSALDEGSSKKLIKISWLTGEGAIKRIEIAGHTDDEGSGDFNNQLSEQRARTVDTWLKSTGDFSNAVTVISWKGESEPLSSNDTKEGKALNRRVELIIHLTVEENFPDALTIKELYTRSGSEPEKFCINNSRDTALVAKHGTIIYIKANSIKLPDDYVCSSCLTVEVKEALFKDDILLENLTTISKGNVLVSQSMVSVNFKCDKTYLQLENGKDYVILSPTDRPVPESKIFYGGWDNDHDHFDWEPGAGTVNALPAGAIKKCNTDGTPFRDVVLPPGCSDCSFLFCGFRKWFGGLTNKERRKVSEEYFKCRKESRARKAGYINQQSKAISDSLAKLYNKQLPLPVRDTNYLDECGRIKSAFRNLFISDSVISDKVLSQSVENMKNNGNPINLKDIENLQYNIYNANRTGWTNIDWMLKVPDDQLKLITIDLPVSEYTDCKLVFREMRTVLPGIRSEDGKFNFPLIPKVKSAWLVLINTKAPKGQINVDLREIITDEQTITPKFQTIRLEDFIPLMKKVNE
jgi:hypothetical protein